MTHYWRIRRWLPERYRQPCRVLVSRSRNGNVLIEFVDGVQVVTSRWNVRTIHELLAKFSADDIAFQRLDEALISVNENRNGTRVTFGTP